jgi:hypothetical protein
VWGSLHTWKRFLQTLGETLQLVTNLPMSARAQLALFTEADVFISVHGAALASSLLLHPGAILIELAPFCTELCTEGCARDRLPLVRLLQLTRRASCDKLLSMYAALHQHTGVRYHVIATCSKGNLCVNGSTPTATARGRRIG